MNKRLAIIIGVCMITASLSTPISAFAVGGSLPKLSTPTLSPLETPKPLEKPTLEKPTLPTDFNTEVDKLKEAGFGQYKYDPTKPLPLPQVEAPAGAGTSAFDVFKQQYGDMWNDPNRQLKLPNNIPDDKFFAAVKDFAAQNQATIDKAKSQDSQVMAGLLKQKLDTSNQFNLDAIKKSAPSISAAEQQAFLNSTPKPAGWDAAKSAASAVPSMDSWLSSTPKAAGYGQSDVWNAVNLLDGVKGDFFGQAKKWMDDMSSTRADKNAVLDAAKQKMMNGQTLTDQDKKNIKDATNKEASTVLRPVTSAINSLQSLGASWNTKEMLNVYNGYQDAEKKYGQGNAVLTGVFFGKPTFSAKDSIPARIAGNSSNLPPYSIYNKDTNATKYYTWQRNSQGIMAPVETDSSTYLKQGGATH